MDLVSVRESGRSMLPLKLNTDVPDAECTKYVKRVWEYGVVGNVNIHMLEVHGHLSPMLDVVQLVLSVKLKNVGTKTRVTKWANIGRRS